MAAAVRKLEAEADTGPGTVLVTLAGKEIEVLPAGQWRQSAISALREGDFGYWAERCLTEKGLTVWDKIDPTMDQVEEFFEAWERSTGQTVGESRASRRSSRSTARR